MLAGLEFVGVVHSFGPVFGLPKPVLARVYDALPIIHRTIPDLAARGFSAHFVVALVLASPA